MKEIVIDNNVFEISMEKTVKFRYLLLQKDGKNYFYKENISDKFIYRHALNNEIYIVELLKNKSIPQIYAYQKDKYILYEYIDGISLNNFEYVSIKNTLLITLNVIKVLRELKGYGYVHCDIKRSNIMISQDNKIYMVDFGSCTLEGEDILFASINSSSPQLLEDKVARFSSDIYSLGILMYEILSNQNLYTNLTMEEAIIQKRNKLRDIKELRNDVSDELNYVIMKCINSTEGEKYTLDELGSILYNLYNNIKNV